GGPAMSSSQIDGSLRVPLDGAAQRDAAPRSFIKRALPRSLFGRSLLIIVTPLILLQVISTWIFYDRHWETVARRLSSSVAGDIALVMEAMSMFDPSGQVRLYSLASRLTDLDFDYRPGEALPDPLPGVTGRGPLSAALRERVQRPFRIDPFGDEHRI